MMTCLFCNKPFTPKLNYNTKKMTEYCSRSCVAQKNMKKLTRLPQLRDKEWLFEQYWIKKRSMKDISKELECSESRVYVFMDKAGITRRTISESTIGKTKSFEHRMNLSDSARNRWRGSNNPNWKGGMDRESLRPRFSYDYEIWRRQVRRKFKDKCAKCGKQLGIKCPCCHETIRTYAHHKKSVKDYPELATSVENGILLCYQCHRSEHKIDP